MTSGRSRKLSEDHTVTTINTVYNESTPIVFEHNGTSFCQRMIDSFKRPISVENVEQINSLNIKDDSVYEHELDNQSTGTGLHRTLKNRHLQMIAIGGSIGNGLFVVSGSALASGGPAALIFNFLITGFMLFNVAMTLGELSVTFPVSGSFASYGSRFLDPAWGFAMGWNYAMNWLIALPIELTSAGLIISYWTNSVSVAVWITIFLVALLIINLFGVRGYAEIEFYISIIKVVAVIAFIIVAFFGIFGLSPSHKYIGGEYWRNPGPFANGFTGILPVFVTAAYAFSGTELVGLAAAETANPRQTIPRATKQVFWRILIFYIGSLTIIGCLVPYTDSLLLNKCATTNGSSEGGVSTSPFVIALNEIGYPPAVASIFNAIILCAVLSVGNSSVYGASRTLCALAENGQAPKILAYIDRKGRPLFSVALSIVVACIAYINVADVGPKVLNWLVALSGLSSFFTWGSICACHIMFRLAWKAQGHTLDELSFVSPFGIIGSCFGLGLNILCLIAQFYTALYPLCSSPSVAGFFQSYLAAPVVLVFYIIWKIWKKPPFMRPSTIDLVTGLRQLNTVELIATEEAERLSWPKWKRIFSRIC